MKSILENSIFVIMFAIIGYVGIDFVAMNRYVSHIEGVQKYIENYVELNGIVCDEKLDNNTLQLIEPMADKENIKLTFDYVGETNEYSFLKMNLEYDLKSNLFNLNSRQLNSGIIQVRKEAL